MALLPQINELVEAYFEATQAFLRTSSSLSKNLEAGLRTLTKVKAELRQLFGQLLEIADKHIPEIWFALGHGYSNGMGIERDLRASEEWFIKAAEAGHTKAMVRLGNQLIRPDRESERSQGIAWLRKAAEAGDSSGMVFLGFAYREGTGVAKDYELAAEWFIKAVAAGDDHAAVHAGRIFASYLSNPKTATIWYRRAAEAGHGDSYIALAEIYDDHHSTCYDPAEAVKWYTAAVDKKGSSVPRSLLALARHYRDGVGVPRDADVARSFINNLITDTPITNEFHKEGLKLLKAMDTELF